MRRRESLTQDMTPLVDVVFLLLIFFLVTTVFKKNEVALNLNLPSSEAGAKVVQRKETTLELTAEAVAVNGKAVDFEALDDIFAGYKNREKPIIVRIDEAVEYRRIVKLFDLLEKYHLHNLQLIEQEKRKSR